MLFASLSSRVIPGLILALASGAVGGLSDVGKPVRQVAEAYHYGAPFSVTTARDGRRVFLWEMKSALTVPSASPAFAGDDIYAAPGAAILAAPPTAKPPVCVYTIWGRWNDKAQAWIIDAVKRPNITCVD